MTVSKQLGRKQEIHSSTVFLQLPQKLEVIGEDKAPQGDSASLSMNPLLISLLKHQAAFPSPSLSQVFSSQLVALQYLQISYSKLSEIPQKWHLAKKVADKPENSNQKIRLQHISTWAITY